MTRSVTNKEQSIFLHLYRSSELHHSIKLFIFFRNRCMQGVAIFWCPVSLNTHTHTHARTHARTHAHKSYLIVGLFCRSCRVLIGISAPHNVSDVPLQETIIVVWLFFFKPAEPTLWGCFERLIYNWSCRPVSPMGHTGRIQYYVQRSLLLQPACVQLNDRMTNVSYSHMEARQK